MFELSEREESICDCLVESAFDNAVRIIFEERPADWGEIGEAVRLRMIGALENFVSYNRATDDGDDSNLDVLPYSPTNGCASNLPKPMPLWP
jgi:hypothetical protein